MTPQPNHIDLVDLAQTLCLQSLKAGIDRNLHIRKWLRYHGWVRERAR